MITLFAQPYDICAAGFYFNSSTEFQQKFEMKKPVEEYEIQFIDGPETALEIFNAMHVSQSNSEAYFEIIESLADNVESIAKFCYLIEYGVCNDVDTALASLDDVTLFEGTVEEYAEDLAESCYFTDDVPNIFKQYFDVESFARDLEIGGDVTTFDFCDKQYVVTTTA